MEKNYKDIFKFYSKVDLHARWVSEGDSSSWLEEIYQAFKDRLMEELYSDFGGEIKEKICTK